MTALANVVRAQCVPDTVCADYPFMPRTVVSIGAPNNPVVPRASLSSATQINSCDNITLDATASTGSGGRPWQSVEWTVTAANVFTKNATDIARYLNANYQDIATNAMAPNYLLTRSSAVEDATYIISLTLTNFMQQSSVSTVSVRVGDGSTITPEVRIFDSDALTFRWKTISVYATAGIPECAGNYSTFPLNYVWRLYRGFTFLESVKSSSLSPRTFTIQPYTLEASTEYTVLLEVSPRGFPGLAPPSATASSVLQLGQSGVVAVIAGGETATTEVGEVLRVDASGSYDVDYPTSAALTFEWECSELSPDFGADCPAEFTGGNVSVLELPAGTLPANVYSISVTVSNLGGQIDTASIELSVVDTRVPTVEVNDVLAKYNPGKKVIITGVVTASDGDAVAQWDSSSIDSFPSAEIALTPLIKSIPQGSSLFQLSIASNSLTAGLTYTFELSAAYVSSSNDAVASVSIVMNQPPSGGVLRVTPGVGTALATTFEFSTSQWTDDSADFPLLYVLGYYNFDTRRLKLAKPSSEVPTVETTLGQGLSSLGYLVICAARASDIYGSEGVAVTTTTVLPFGLPAFSSQRLGTLLNIEVESVSLLAASLLSSALQNEDSVAIMQVADAALAALNEVDCNVPTNCASINREICQTTSNTCGPCLSGYVGVSGDSNVECGDIDTSLSIGSVCSDDDQCVTGSCTGGLCADILKTCPGDCSNRGTCEFFDMNGIQIEECFVTDDTCSAFCHCNTRFGAACLHTLSDFNAMSELRAELCYYVFESLPFVDVTSDVVRSRALAVSSAILDYSQVSFSALSNCSTALIETIVTYPAVSCEEETFPVVVRALSSLVSTGLYLPDGLVANVSKALAALAGGCQETIALGEQFLSIATPFVRINTAIVENGMNSFSSPLTDFEAFNQEATAVVTIDSTNSSNDAVSGSSLGVTLFEYNNNPHGQVVNSSSVGVQTIQYDNLPSEGSDGRRTRRRRRARRRLDFPSYSLATAVVLVNSEPIDYTSRRPKVIPVRCFDYKSNEYRKKVTCPNGLEVNVTCPARKKGIEEITCPGFTTVPQCTMWDGEEFAVNPDCEVVSFNAYNTTCACRGDSARRILQQQGGSSSGILEFSSRYEVVNTDFGRSFIAAPDQLEVEHNYVILITLCTFVGIYVFGLLWLLYVGFRRRSSKVPVSSHKYSSSSGRTIRGFFDAIYPPDLKPQVWYEKFWKHLREQHSFLSLNDPREASAGGASIAKWTVALGRLIIFMFCSSVVAFLMYADDGYCERFDGRKDCEAAETTGGYFKACDWNPDNESCFFQRPDITFVTSIILTLVVSIVSMPARHLLRYLVHNSQQILIGQQVTSSHVIPVHVASSEVDMKKKELKSSNRSSRKAPESLRGSRDSVGSIHSRSSDGDSTDRREFDEFVHVCSNASTMLRAARLEKSRQTIDFVSPTEESELITATARERREVEIANRTGSGPSAILLPSHDKTRYGSTALSVWGISHSVHAARTRANSVRRLVESTHSSSEREKLLIKNFIVDVFTGAKRRIVSEHLFGGDRNVRLSSLQTKLVQYGSLVLLSCMLCAMVLLTYGLSLRIGSRSSDMWLLITLLSFAQDAVFFQPLRIWVREVFIASIVVADLQCLILALAGRSKLILMRTHGLMRESSAMVQHFNPACRVARMYPGLPVSRLLMSINDHDIPYSASRGAVMHIYEWLQSSFLLVVFLPQVLQGPVLDVLCTLSLGVLVIAFYLFGKLSAVAASLVLVALLLPLLLWQAWKERKRHLVQAVRRKQAQEEAFEELGGFEEIFTDVDPSSPPVRSLKLKPQRSKKQLNTSRDDSTFDIFPGTVDSFRKGQESLMFDGDSFSMPPQATAVGEDARSPSSPSLHAGQQISPRNRVLLPPLQQGASACPSPSLLEQRHLSTVKGSHRASFIGIKPQSGSQQLSTGSLTLMPIKGPPLPASDKVASVVDPHLHDHMVNLYNPYGSARVGSVSGSQAPQQHSDLSSMHDHLNDASSAVQPDEGSRSASSSHYHDAFAPDRGGVQFPQKGSSMEDSAVLNDTAAEPAAALDYLDQELGSIDDQYDNDGDDSGSKVSRSSIGWSGRESLKIKIDSETGAQEPPLSDSRQASSTFDAAANAQSPPSPHSPPNQVGQGMVDQRKVQKVPSYRRYSGRTRQRMQRHSTAPDPSMLAPELHYTKTELGPGGASQKIRDTGIDSSLAAGYSMRMYQGGFEDQEEMQQQQQIFQRSHRGDIGAPPSSEVDAGDSFLGTSSLLRASVSSFASSVDQARNAARGLAGESAHRLGSSFSAAVPMSQLRKQPTHAAARTAHASFSPLQPVSPTANIPTAGFSPSSSNISPTNKRGSTRFSSRRFEMVHSSKLQPDGTRNLVRLSTAAEAAGAAVNSSSGNIADAAAAVTATAAADTIAGPDVGPDVGPGSGPGGTLTSEKHFTTHSSKFPMYK